ncbi:DUF2490 domain-containing protein [Polymorphobacter sp.]|uniref:DUF2490 domain-containing protein n=1 Tax=Polymorphobacter sp. TaxID=1909290 RepID=UPI003F6F3F36
MFRFLLMLLIAAPAVTPASADEQVWVAGIAQGPVSGRLITWLEVQPRFTGGAGRLGQTILRPALGYQVDPGTTLLAGYAYIESNPEGLPDIREHRTWQQLQTRLAGTPGKAVLVSRTRLEQRFVEGQDDDAMRLRQFLRGQVWVGDAGWSLIGVSEAFIGLESTPWGQRAGLEQIRNFAGVGIPLSDRLTLEAGYLNQRLVRAGPDATNHVLNLNLFFRLG